MSDKPKPEYRENLNPQQTYQLTMRIADAPGGFGWIQGFMQFDVTNPECLPPPKDNPGGHTSPIPTRSIPFDLQKVAEDEYTATVFADGMIDEDYHGRGMCQWKLVQVQVQLKATGSKSETLFIPSLGRRELRSDEVKPQYFLKASYPRHPESTLDEPIAFGQPNRLQMASSLSDEDLFTITLSMEEAGP
ncbi:hypothetical protein [Marilutibacter alkalisoli]|uniref:Uncharacterized protein n=1 Tax=Marilutibacter alkalisoli TaxID=2591633 RepID=A0A514BVF5_9GAMM|nr:hypothetical protein [Lysobacter alkalisoli]QDH71342.1 hypothetical protein FKV23_15535 [Lysobacter alkalisoli]